MSNRETNRLRQYSALAAALICAHPNTHAQVVYTDLDPDIILHFDGQTAGIDMDNNGTYDFAFFRTNNYFSDSLYSDYEYRYILWCGPYGTPQNEIAGIYVTHGECCGTSYKPYALSEGDTIDDALSFQYAGYQLMAVGFYRLFESAWIWHYGPAYWSPPVDSAYLGVRFLGEDHCLHYGWIRCSTTDSCKTLIIHDYAYESQCEKPIIAGDMVGDTTSIGIHTPGTLAATVYSYGKTVFVILPAASQQTQIQVFDITGKVVYAGVLHDPFNKLYIPDPTGVYMVELREEDRVYNRKIILGE